VDGDEVVRRTLALDVPRGLHHAFSITGGEPLEQAGFLAAVLRGLAAGQPVVMLETNGVMTEELSSVIDLVDVVAMDYKLASATGRPTPLEAHREFLAVGLRKRVFVKAVVTERTTDEELDALAECVVSQSRSVPVILQPVMHSGSLAPRHQRLLAMHARLAVCLESVRIVPQVHKVLGIP
jgi:organic radical activating enzyme